MKTLIVAALALMAFAAHSQSKQYNRLYQYGTADAFLAGLYNGELPVKQVSLHGDFGLGAPDLLDGEVVLLDGNVYQTRSSGQTTVMPDTARLPLVLSTFFRCDTTFYITDADNKKAVFAMIDRYLSRNNALYAIRISGDFNYVKTRAFPPVDKQPYLPLADMLNRQHFFIFEKISGTLVGFRLPQYLSSVTIADHHYHFLSNDKAHGGHMTDVSIATAKIEIAVLKGIDIDIPQDARFMNFDFKQVKKGDAEKAEKQ